MLTVRLFILLLLLHQLPLMAFSAGVTSFHRTVQANGGAFNVKGVVIDLRDAKISIKVGLAWERVGRTESLDSIAKRYGAAAAINGSFFDAYTNDVLKNPDMTLITDGRLIFKSNLGSVLGFEADNTPHLGLVRHKLQGTITREKGVPLSWYAYWVNRKPTAAQSVTLFTREWGDTVEPMGGTSAVIETNMVTAITQSAVKVPEDGFVLHFRGETSLLSRFAVGRRLTFSPETNITGGTADEWTKVQEAVGAGPRVLVNGVPVFDPRSEGFNDPKILERSGARSAAGFTKDGKLYLITTPTASVRQLGHILKALGCTDGMNLDGGASSSLWYRGAYLTKPGRQISNALLVVEKK